MAKCDIGEGVKKCPFMSEVLFELALWVIAHGKMFKKCGSLSKIYRQSFLTITLSSIIYVKIYFYLI